MHVDCFVIVAPLLIGAVGAWQLEQETPNERWRLCAVALALMILGFGGVLLLEYVLWPISVGKGATYGLVDSLWILVVGVGAWTLWTCATRAHWAKVESKRPAFILCTCGACVSAAFLAAWWLLSTP